MVNFGTPKLRPITISHFLVVDEIAQTICRLEQDLASRAWLCFCESAAKMGFNFEQIEDPARYDE